MEWPLVLRTGFGNVHPLGRWDSTCAVIIAEACNTDLWDDVIELAQTLEWDDDESN